MIFPALLCDAARRRADSSWSGSCNLSENLELAAVNNAEEEVFLVQSCEIEGPYRS